MQDCYQVERENRLQLPSFDTFTVSASEMTTHAPTISNCRSLIVWHYLHCISTLRVEKHNSLVMNLFGTYIALEYG